MVQVLMITMPETLGDCVELIARRFTETVLKCAIIQRARAITRLTTKNTEHGRDETRSKNNHRLCRSDGCALLFQP